MQTNTYGRLVIQAGHHIDDGNTSAYSTKACHTFVRYFRYLVVNHMFFANFILCVCLISLFQTKTEFKSGATLRAGLIIFLREDKERIRSLQGTRCWQ